MSPSTEHCSGVHERAAGEEGVACMACGARQRWHRAGSHATPGTHHIGRHTAHLCPSPPHWRPPVNMPASAAHRVGRHKVHLHSRVHGQHVGQGAHGTPVGQVAHLAGHQPETGRGGGGKGSGSNAGGRCHRAPVVAHLAAGKRWTGQGRRRVEAPPAGVEAPAAQPQRRRRRRPGPGAGPPAAAARAPQRPAASHAPQRGPGQPARTSPILNVSRRPISRWIVYTSSSACRAGGRLVGGRGRGRD